MNLQQGKYIRHYYESLKYKVVATRKPDVNDKKRSVWGDPGMNPEKRKREGIPFLFVKSWDYNFT